MGEEDCLLAGRVVWRDKGASAKLEIECRHLPNRTSASTPKEGSRERK